MSIESTPQSIIEFWFSEQVKPLWFNSTKEFDDQLRDKYLGLLESAERGELDNWKHTAEGCLALCIILDQFPLNMFRGQARSFATEAQAREIARYAIDQGLDQVIPKDQLAFLYLPYMHSENLSDQDVSVSLFEKAGLTDNVRYAKHHREIVKRFGRFPHRNKALARQSTNEEIAYLNSDGAFHG